MKLNIKQFVSKFTSAIIHYRVIIIWLAIFGLLGFTLWRLQAISDPQPDPVYMETRRNDPDSQVTGIRLSDELRQTIDSLRPNPVDVSPEDLGTLDPFNP